MVSLGEIRALADALPALVFVTDASGRITFTNARFQRYCGKNPDELLDAGWLGVLHPDDKPRAGAIWAGAAANAEPREGEYRLRSAAGDYRWHLCRSEAVRDAAGVVSQWVGTCTDIEEQKRNQLALRESESRLAAALQIAQLGIAEYDAVTDRFVGDARWAQIMGVPPGSALSVDEFVARVHPDDQAELLERMKRASEPAETGDFEASYRIVGADGAVTYVETRGRLVVDVARKGDHSDARFVGTVMDVTVRRQAEERLREADRRKDEFLAMLAHELRNPLAPIANVVRLLESVLEPEPSTRQLLDILARQTRTLSALVDDLLDVARITRGLIGVKRERVALGPVIDAALECVQPLFDEKRHHVTVTLPRKRLEVMGDQVRLEQVLINILANAAKYTDPDGNVAIVADCADGEVEIRVRDDGIGIAPELLEQIFDLFGQAERGLDRSQGGLGIGLSLTKGLVELHGGRIEAISEGLGKGAELVVRLPLAPAESTCTGRPAHGNGCAALAPRRVLVVDDNVDAADTLVLLLNSLGHEAVVAYDGSEALARVEKSSPELVLLDIGLPGMDGYEVARRLREIPQTRDMRIAALTGYGQENDRARTQAARFDAHFVKPVDIAALRAFLSEAAVTT